MRDKKHNNFEKTCFLLSERFVEQNVDKNIVFFNERFHGTNDLLNEQFY